jgi:RND family efflux transporter MFP subunit
MSLRILAFASVLMLTACQDDQPNRSSSNRTANTHSVLIEKVEQRSLPVIYPVPGTIVAKDHLQVASRITGYIDHIDVEEGDLVEPGAVLVRIDGTQVEATIRGVEAAIVSARAELQDAKGDLKRYRALSKTQALAEDQIRDAEVRRTKAKAALAQAQAELEAKQQDLRHIHLTSPVWAQVRERLRDQGDLASAGEPILRLDVLSSMELEIYLSSSQIGSITKGQKLDVFVQSSSHPITGEVMRIVRSADSVTRRSKVRIALPNNHGLSPGQFARAHILLGQEMAPAVPVSAIVERAGIEGVFVVEGNDTARFRSIRTGKLWQDYREVLAGVEAGLSVVLKPPVRLRDGDRIKRATPDGN